MKCDLGMKQDAQFLQDAVRRSTRVLSEEQLKRIYHSNWQNPWRVRGRERRDSRAAVTDDSE